ncbi:N-acetylmuramoyl-L-alanine amidase [Undibacterium sp. SXout20W]|uniref:N-acetylmuramoyl-L-alanine amidase n=1 Tax=Undibacterium sp. SXout20W TaxID=3413051 RepID=UPI003BF3DBF9
MKKLFFAGLLGLSTALLSGCATTGSPSAIDHSVSAKGQEDRIQFIILHYTAIDQATSLRVLSTQDVSAHYLVGNENPIKVWQLVDESRMAYHAGYSDWRDFSRLNASSIGIEIVNLGYKETPDGRVCFPFPQAQIDRVIALVKDISARYHIRPQYILAHSDIAPQRKPDPGPLFPWKQLADAGLIPWPDATEVAVLQPTYEQQLPDVKWFQQRLSKIGYHIPQSGIVDEATKNVLIAFQMKYRPERFDGAPDAQTAALIDVLLSKIKQ